MSRQSYIGQVEVTYRSLTATNGLGSRNESRVGGVAARRCVDCATKEGQRRASKGFDDYVPNHTSTTVTSHLAEEVDGYRNRQYQEAI